MSNSDSGKTINVQIYSDIVCPWCYIGKRRFEKALQQMEAPNLVQVTWLPFELNPNMPEHGVERREYRIKKFGTWEYSQTLDAQVSAAGLAEGIGFNYEIMQRTPNTRKGHLLIQFAQMRGHQDAVVEALFSAYFCEGRDIGEPAVLVQIAASAGLNSEQLSAFFNTDEALERLKDEEANGRRMGINGVPAFVIDGAVAFTGAQDPSTIAKRLYDLTNS